MYDALVIGAGPAGLAISRELLRRGVRHVVLERGEQSGQTWAHLYKTLVLHTARGLSTLPGLAYPRGTPLFPTREQFLAYLHRYADVFELPVNTRTEVTSLRRERDGWIARTSQHEELSARAIVMATGIVANPYVPQIPGRADFGGRVLHSVDYRQPDGFERQRVLVVGAGNSAGEISVELARAGAQVTLGVRTGADVVPREIAGIPIQYFAVPLSALPKSAQRVVSGLIARASAAMHGPSPLPRSRPDACPNVPLIGLHVAEALRTGAIRLAGGIAAFSGDGVRFDDGSMQRFDAVILATGYRAALGPLAGTIRVDQCGFGLRRDGIVSADHPGLYFVGHNYDVRGAIFNIRRDARRAARRLTSEIGGTSRTSTGTRPQPNER